MAPRSSLLLLLGGSCLLGADGVRARRKQSSEVQVKHLSGVPIYNYHLAYEQAASLSQVEGEVDWIVAATPGSSDRQLEQLCKAAGKRCKKAGHPSMGGVPYIEIEAQETDLEQMIKASPNGVAFIEPNLPCSIIPEIQNVPSTMSASWGLDRVGASQSGKTGAGAHVYVLDTGVRTSHRDFGGRAIPEVDMTVDPEEECSGNTDCAVDNQGHGTHCAGTVAGGSYGVAPGASIHGVKVLGDGGSGSWSASFAALDYVATKGERPSVVSMSLGGTNTQYTMRVSVDAAVAAGVVVVVAAGNANADACQFSPAFVQSAITVGSINEEDSRSYFSNYGRCTNIWAPGSNIVSASHKSDIGFRSLSGTSMACPHVSGGAALLLGSNQGLSPADVRAQLLAQAEEDAISDLKNKDTNKLLWVGDALAPVPAPTPPPPPPPGCPDFARRPQPDGEGDCMCQRKHYCSTDGEGGAANCPTASGYGAWGGGLFASTCSDCFCYVK